jgi:hypothetical protein
MAKLLVETGKAALEHANNEVHEGDEKKIFFPFF